MCPSSSHTNWEVSAETPQSWRDKEHKLVIRERLGFRVDRREISYRNQTSPKKILNIGEKKNSKVTKVPTLWMWDGYNHLVSDGMIGVINPLQDGWTA